MSRYLVLCFLLTTTMGASARGWEPSEFAADLVNAGLVLEDSGSSPADTRPDETKPCERVSFTRNLKYGESDLNVLDVATADVRDTSPRPVLLFVAGENFFRRSGHAYGAGPP